MSATTRRNSPDSSRLAEQRINTAAANDTREITPTTAVEACIASLREFSERDVAVSMKLRFPGDDERSGTICSPERIRGILSDMKKAGKVVKIDDSGERERFRFVVEVPVKLIQKEIW